MGIHTLCVQVVLDRNGVILCGNEGVLLLGLSQRVPVARVLLLEILDLVLHRECFLFIPLVTDSS